jgi:hypothetical protein
MVVLGENRSAGLGWPWRLGLRLAGAGLLAAAGAIHLDLYLTGYRTIPTIGWLFLLQVIAAFALALAVLVTGSRLAAAAGAGGYDGFIWPHHDGFMWLHLTAPVTVRCGPVSSGSEKKGLVRAGATSSRHAAADDQGGATSKRPSGPNSSRPSHTGS